MDKLLGEYDIALDNETYATNAYIPAMRDFFSEVNNDDWFGYVNGKHTFMGTFQGTDLLKVKGYCNTQDRLGRDAAYDKFEMKEKPFRMSTTSKACATAAFIASNVVIPGHIFEIAALAGASLFYYGYETSALDVGEKMYSKIPFASYETRLNTIMDKLIDKGATEKTSDEYNVCKDLELNGHSLDEITFKPLKGNSEVKLKANEDTLNVSIFCEGAALKIDSALFKAVLSYAESKGIEPVFKSEELKNYYEAHKDDKTSLESCVDFVVDWLNK